MFFIVWSHKNHFFFLIHTYILYIYIYILIICISSLFPCLLYNFCFVFVVFCFIYKFHLHECSFYKKINQTMSWKTLTWKNWVYCHLKTAATTELEKIWITNTACGVTHKTFSFDSCTASTTVMSSIKVSCSYGNFCVPWVKQSLATYV